MKLPTSGLVTLSNNKMLLAYSKNKKAWYLPGGKMDEGETAVEALVREVEEELSLTLSPGDLEYLLHVTAHAYGEPMDVIMEQDCFLYDLQEEIHASHEIGAVKYFSFEDYLLEPVRVVGVIEVFNFLKSNDYLK